jgi:pimeloyl-ACP methyl ester carboxylesterase
VDKFLIAAITVLFVSFVLISGQGMAAGRILLRRHLTGSEMMVEEPVFHGKVYLCEAGVGRPTSVVLIHGVGDRGAKDWEFLVPFLSERYHVLAFDLPGFGRSSRQNELYSPARYAEFVKWVVDRYVKGPFVLIGHSFGGAVALRYAAGAPPALQRLILVDVAGILHRVAYAKHLVHLSTPQAWQSNLPGNPVDSINDVVRTVLDTVNGEVVSKHLDEVINSPSLRKTVLGPDPERVASFALILEDFSQAIDQVRTPTLVIWGAHDTVAPLRTGKVLAGRMPAARLEIIPQAGHVPMLDQSEKFNRVVLKEISAPPAGPNSSTEKQPSATDRIGRCENETGATFTGGYRLIVISNASTFRSKTRRSDCSMCRTQRLLLKTAGLRGTMLR